MVSITIIPKHNPNQQQTVDMNEILITEASVVNLSLTKEDIESSSLEGTTLIINLKNGEKITIENFVAKDLANQNTLLLKGENETYTLVHLDQQGQITDYLGNVDLDDFLLSSTVVSTQPDLIDEGGFSLADFLEEHGAKVGLGVATLLGVAPLLLDSNKEKKAPVAPDTEKPEAATAVLSSDGQKISGTAEANASILILDTARNIIAKATVDSSGKYEVQIPKESQTGQVLSVFVEDAAGNVSTATTVTSQDHVEPIVLSAQMNDAGTNVIGKSEPESNVYLYAKDGKLITSAKTNVAGDFSIVLQSPLPKDTVAYVVLEDKAGNKSKQYEVIVGKDTTPPETPTIFEVIENGSILKGKAEANSDLKLQNAKGDVIAVGKANANGDFSLNISPALTKDDQAKLIVTDKNNNSSQPATIGFDTDTLSPSVPTATLTKDGLQITGKAEAGSTIMVKSLDNKVTLGTAKVDDNGDYKVLLEKPLTDKVKVNVTAQDLSKNESGILVVEGIDKDTIAPSLATITDIKDDVGAVKGSVKNNAETDDTKPTLIGKGEANAIVTIYDNDNLIGTVKVDAQGAWQFTPEKDLALGEHSITLYQTDSSNNMSLVSPKYMFKVVAQETVSKVSSFDDSNLIDDVINNAITSSGSSELNHHQVDTELKSTTELLDTDFNSRHVQQDVFELQQPTPLF